MQKILGRVGKPRQRDEGRDGRNNKQQFLQNSPHDEIKQAKTARGKRMPARLPAAFDPSRHSGSVSYCEYGRAKSFKLGMQQLRSKAPA